MWHVWAVKRTTRRVLVQAATKKPSNAGDEH